MLNRVAGSIPNARARAMISGRLGATLCSIWTATAWSDGNILLTTKIAVLSAGLASHHRSMPG